MIQAKSYTLLDLPFASLVNQIEVIDDKSMRVGREIEGGNQEINEIEMPCVKFCGRPCIHANRFIILLESHKCMGVPN